MTNHRIRQGDDDDDDDDAEHDLGGVIGDNGIDGLFAFTAELIGVAVAAGADIMIPKTQPFALLAKCYS